MQSDEVPIEPVPPRSPASQRGTSSDQRVGQGSVAEKPEPSSQGNLAQKSPATIKVPGVPTFESPRPTPEENRAEAAVRARFARGEGTPAQAVEHVVMNPANPCLSIYREYVQGQLTLDELNDSIDALCCTDEKMMKAYERKVPPSAPDVLRKAIGELVSKSNPSQWDALTAELKSRLAAMNPDVDRFLKTERHVENENRAHLSWLRDMHARQHGRNAVYETRILAAIETHGLN